MIAVDQHESSDCLRACIASIFEIPWEDAPDTAPPPGIELTDRSWSQHNIVNKWLKARGLVHWTLECKPDDRPVLRRGQRTLPDGATEPSDFMWPYPMATHYVGGGTSPRGVDHSVVMFAGKIVHDPNSARDMGIEAITSITVYCARLLTPALSEQPEKPDG
jgi:hypothetical protein